MSRVGQAPIAIPNKVTVSISPENLVQVTGPLGELSLQVRPGIGVQVDGDTLTVTRPNDERRSRAQHGLYRALIANMVNGVSHGFERRLQIEGVGYRADMEGKRVKLRVGLSHEVLVEPLPGTELLTEGTQTVVVKGCCRGTVGQMAANIRAIRPVEPYKGKGIRYQGEHVRRKAGKASKVGG